MDVFFKLNTSTSLRDVQPNQAAAAAAAAPAATGVPITDINTLKAKIAGLEAENTTLKATVAASGSSMTDAVRQKLIDEKTAAEQLLEDKITEFKEEQKKIKSAAAAEKAKTDREKGIIQATFDAFKAPFMYDTSVETLAKKLKPEVVRAINESLKDDSLTCKKTFLAKLQTIGQSEHTNGTSYNDIANALNEILAKYQDAIGYYKIVDEPTSVTDPTAQISLKNPTEAAIITTAKDFLKMTQDQINAELVKSQIDFDAGLGKTMDDLKAMLANTSDPSHGDLIKLNTGDAITDKIQQVRDSKALVEKYVSTTDVNATAQNIFGKNASADSEYDTVKEIFAGVLNATINAIDAEVQKLDDDAKAEAAKKAAEDAAAAAKKAAEQQIIDDFKLTYNTGAIKFKTILDGVVTDAAILKKAMAVSTAGTMNTDDKIMKFVLGMQNDKILDYYKFDKDPSKRGILKTYMDDLTNYITMKQEMTKLVGDASTDINDAANDSLKKFIETNHANVTKALNLEKSGADDDDAEEGTGLDATLQIPSEPTNILFESIRKKIATLAPSAAPSAKISFTPAALAASVSQLVVSNKSWDKSNDSQFDDNAIAKAISDIGVTTLSELLNAATINGSFIGTINASVIITGVTGKNKDKIGGVNFRKAEFSRAKTAFNDKFKEITDKLFDDLKAAAGGKNAATLKTDIIAIVDGSSTDKAKEINTILDPLRVPLADLIEARKIGTLTNDTEINEYIALFTPATPYQLGGRRSKKSKLAANDDIYYRKYMKYKHKYINAKY